MTSFQWYCFVVAALIIGNSQAQCMVRTLIPMTMMDSMYPPGSLKGDEEGCGTTAEDLSALLLLARALEMDRANSATNGIDINNLLITLINGLVYVATQERGYGSGNGGDSWQGYKPYYPNIASGNSGSSGGSNGGSSAGSSAVSSAVSSAGSSAGSNGGSYGGSNNNDPLIDLHLLQPGKDNVAALNLGSNKVLGIGLGGDNSGSDDGGIL